RSLGLQLIHFLYIVHLLESSNHLHLKILSPPAPASTLRSNSCACRSPKPGEVSLIPAAIRAALAGEDFPITRGEQRRDFIFVGDVVEGFLAAAAAPDVDGESLDLGTGQAYAVREVVERIWAMAKATGRIRAGALPYRPGEVMYLAADADRTARLTGWRAEIGLDEGLRQTIEWIRGKPNPAT
ncbi:MAG TPA: NAD-dependent epimerase/dehydratase family protein, partial [Anaerolineae bacterium]|nr:NAD-dependent epimerase/dehydratase family protein [Anaerolineae bacterium]